jgi:diguanylate cyclase (GGDEF)-like protein
VAGLLFVALLAMEAAGLLFFGTGRAGLACAVSGLVLASLVALACALRAFRRAQGVTAMFWFLFAAMLLVLLIPTLFQDAELIFDLNFLSFSTRSLLYCLYGAPILMMLFLPDSYGSARVKSEIFLDLFQMAIVVGLIYSTFFFLPVQRMLPDEALLRNVSISDAQTLLLWIAVFVRLQFARISASRSLLIRLILFVSVCVWATFVGDWIDLHHYSVASAWFNLGWTIPQIAAGFIALTWEPSPSASEPGQPANFLSFLGANLVLVAMLSCVALLTNRWKQAHGELLTNLAIAASLVAFTLRLALTQFHQQLEIARRKAAQSELTASNEKVVRLLADAREQTIEITQISELGSLLQACATREEVFRLIPERLRRLFPGASGCIALLSASKNRAESVASWGITPASQLFSPEQCWALRRGCNHIHPGGASAIRCSHLLYDGPSICIPLIANGEAIGILAVQQDDSESGDRVADRPPEAFARRAHLACAVAEHVAVAIANLGLRESLRLQAVRDPLTGLYNRRYMQEFLEHELHSARRRHRPVAVMMLDLDHFKRYNDDFGHAAGDHALAVVSDLLQRCVRSEDVACRYGGEEFTLILPECSLSQVTVRAEEIRKRVKDLCIHDKDSSRGLSLSIGVAAFDETTDRVDLLLKFADDALYRAKRAGRDRVIAASPASAVPLPEALDPADVIAANI